MKLAAILVAGLLLQQDLRFRSQANITAIDVTVVDQDGRVVRTLAPEDFVVTANKKTLPVVSAQFVETRAPNSGAPMALPEPDLSASVASTNRSAERGRVFVLAIDTMMISRGQGRSAMRDIGAFLDHLAPQDLVGLVSLPTGQPRVWLTRDRAPIRAALTGIAGAGEGFTQCGPTYGEAAVFASGDRSSAMRAMRERLGADSRCGFEEDDVRAATGQFQIQTRVLLDSIGKIADSLRDSPGLKTIVVVSEGMYLDRDLEDDVSRLTARAEASRARVYGLHLYTPPVGLSRGSAISSQLLDDRFGFNAMSRVSMATGGTAMRVTGSAVSRLDRIEQESSGYYLLGVEVDPAAAGDGPLALSVQTRWPGVQVRARWMFSARPERGGGYGTDAVRDSALAAATLLADPVSAGEIPIDVDTIEAPGSPAASRLVIVADIGASPADVAAVGFHLATADGRTIAGRVEHNATLPANGAGASYLVGADVEPGDYRLRVSAVTKSGARGSVERRFVVPPATTAGPLAMSLLRVEGTAPPTPIAALAPGQQQLGVRVEWPQSVSRGAVPSVRIRIARLGESKWLGDTTFPVSTDSGTPSASGAINTGQLPKGQYVLKAELWLDGATRVSTAKQFEVR